MKNMLSILALSFPSSSCCHLILGTILNHLLKQLFGFENLWWTAVSITNTQPMCHQALKQCLELQLQRMTKAYSEQQGLKRCLSTWGQAKTFICQNIGVKEFHGPAPTAKLRGFWANQPSRVWEI